jgi:SWI/SNF-related matrix-associated actin-dependent regulator of chromatin subfamily A3
MGLGKTITCVSLLAATLNSAREFASSPLDPVSSRQDFGNDEIPISASHFNGSVWGMPNVSEAMSAKEKAKAAKVQEKTDAALARQSRIKAKSRATLIICPLSTVSNWEDQFREHWRGEVTIIGGAGGACTPVSFHAQATQSTDVKTEQNPPPVRKREGHPLRVYVYHGNARRPEPEFLADFDAVITTYATLATEFSKQNRRIAAEMDDEEDDPSSDGGGVDVDERGNQVLRLPKPKKAGLKRKKSGLGNCSMESISPLQSIHWFRVVLDEAQLSLLSIAWSRC